MYKVFLSVRNRLGITKKCIKSLEKHSKIPYQLFIYDNQTDKEFLEKHTKFYKKLLLTDRVSQVTFNTKSSTFNAFSKAAAWNFFGCQHEQDPNKDKYNFLLLIDNDMILTPDFDNVLNEAWQAVKTNKLKNIRIISQLPGGIRHVNNHNFKIRNQEVLSGRLGGSGFWCVKTNFFRDIGFLDLNKLINHDKKHDQMYWRLLDLKTNGKPYILGLRHKLAYHCGSLAGSVCNGLTRNGDIKFRRSNERIENVTFNDFYKKILKDKTITKGW